MGGGAFVRLCVVFLALALGACAYNPKTGELRLVGDPKALRTGETYVDPATLATIYFGNYDDCPECGAELCPNCGRCPYGSRNCRPINEYKNLIPVSRWAIGGEIGGLWGTGEMDHFFPPANTNSRINDFVATGTLEYSRALAYNSRNGVITWGRIGLDITTPTSGHSSPNFGGEVLDSRIGWQFAPKIGVSMQFTEKNGRTAGIFPLNHCMWIMGGPVFANVKDTFADEQHSKTTTGWTIGAGLDFNYSSQWTARVSINYTDLGTNTVPLPGGPVRIDHTDWALKIGLLKRFETFASPRSLPVM